VPWTIDLRRALDADPVGQNVKIVGADNGWDICRDMLQNETFRDSIAVIGVHYAAPPPTPCLELHKPIWTSEGWNLGNVNDFDGALDLARNMNTIWTQQTMRAMIVWTIVYAWYSILPFSRPDPVAPVGGLGHGLMSATEPWSGHYSIQPPLYAMAHTTQFVSADGSCRYVNNSFVGTNGTIGGDRGSVVAFVCNQSIVTLVLVTADSNASWSPACFELYALPSALTTFHAYRTNSNSSFEKLPDLTVSVNGSLCINELQPAAIYTLSTELGGRVPDPDPPIPSSRPFPMPYADDFRGYADQATVRYFADQAGSWNAVPASAAPVQWRPVSANQSLFKQVVTELPIAWERNHDPFTLIGDSQTWANYTVQVDALAERSAPASLVQRTGVQPLHNGDKADHCLSVPSGQVQNGTEVVCSPCSDEPNQDWIYREQDRSVRSGVEGDFCLTAVGLAEEAEAADALPFYGVQVFKCNSTDEVKHCSRTHGCQRFGYDDKLTLTLLADEYQKRVAISSKLAGDSFNVGFFAANPSDSRQTWTRAASPACPKEVYVQVCGRIHTYERDGAPIQGYCLRLSHPTGMQAQWSLLRAGSPVAAGVLNATSTPVWHTLRISFSGSIIEGSIDGKVVVRREDIGSAALPQLGMAALGSGWHPAYFGAFSVVLL
jgi:hypothetical protein